MASVTEQLNAIRNDVQSLRTRLISLTPNDILYSYVGECVLYGCRVTEGVDATDMTIALQGEGDIDADYVNPDIQDPPTRGFEYPNIANLKDGAFRAVDLTAVVDDVPSTGLGRYDIAYVYVGPNGAGFAVATGTPASAVKTDFDSNGLDVSRYGEAEIADPQLPVGAMPVARIYVEDDITGIPDSRIADIRHIGTVDALEAFLVDAQAAQEAAETAQQGAETAQGLAETAQTAAETAQGLAETAQTGAETAQGLAETAQAGAETAQGLAETAQGHAETAQSLAENARDDAQTHAGTALGYVSDASDQKTYAEEWANKAEDSPVSVSAGGDGSTEFSARHWAAKAEASAAEAAGTSISGMTDVTLTSLGAGEILLSTSGGWVNATLAEAGISAVGHTHSIENVTDLQSSLDAKAPINNATLTGTTSVAALNTSGISDLATAATHYMVESSGLVRPKPLANVKVEVVTSAAVNAAVATVSQAEAEAGTATTNRLWTSQRVNQAVVAVTGILYSAQVLIVTEEQTSGANATALGTNSSISTRALNTVLTNTIPGASLSSSEITLPAGTYDIAASSPCYLEADGAVYKSRLYDTTASAVLVYGTTLRGSGGGTVRAIQHSFIVGQFTLSVSSVVRIEYYKTLAAGAGLASTTGDPEVYTVARITRVRV